VQKEWFNNLLANYTSLTSAEATELASLSNDFPYCQVIHNLAARAAQDNALSTKEKLLTISAIYSTDRGALKSIMTAPARTRVDIKVSAPVASPIPSVAEQVLTSSIDQRNNDQFLDQLMADFAEMHKSKEAFEQFIETMEGQKVEPLTPAPVEKKKAEPKPMALHGNDLIEEIKSTKKKIKPETTKQIEQIEIIDQFIKTQPSIARTKGVTNATPPETNDLSESSGQFGENIVSETLVEILLKQGKKDKAIEALKKLIWKFPQKKAYFAAQIEDLRK
jgi:hypothetical protein